MAISKRLRFQIFSRDNFTCRYCGQSAPDVRLEVDHRHPRHAGGDDSPENLVTACFDCNRGKGPLLVAPQEDIDGALLEKHWDEYLSSLSEARPERCELPRWMGEVEPPPVKLNFDIYAAAAETAKPFDWNSLIPAFDAPSEVA